MRSRDSANVEVGGHDTKAEPDSPGESIVRFRPTKRFNKER